MAGKPNSKWLETMIEKHGSLEAVKERQRAIGAKGGQNGTTGGFASDALCQCHGKRLSVCAGIKGGKISKRRPGGLAYV